VIRYRFNILLRIGENNGVATTRTMKIPVCICGTLLAIALVPTAVARADIADETYLKAVADHGITAVMASLHLSIPQAELVVNDAASAYCPWDLALGL
jgi:hypothetical protein